MTVFTAYQAVNLSTGGLGSILASIINSHSVVFSFSTEFEMTDSGATMELDAFAASGHHFVYGHGLSKPPTGGVISLLFVYKDFGSGFFNDYAFDHLSLPVTTLFNDISHAKYTALANAIFGGNDRINGSVFADRLFGFGGKDKITGDTGNDRMTGGPGADTFIFRAGFGQDVITDFTLGTIAVHDTIELHSIAGLGGFHQVKTHSAVVGGHVVIHDDIGDTIALLHVASKAALHGFDFHFP